MESRRLETDGEAGGRRKPPGALETKWQKRLEDEMWRESEL